MKTKTEGLSRDVASLNQRMDMLNNRWKFLDDIIKVYIDCRLCILFRLHLKAVFNVKFESLSRDLNAKKLQTSKQVLEPEIFLHCRQVFV